ncbi:hypothetical protein [Aquimarina megaterium]|uniref:hypothetical protein n=1 Tax=Aquimarina megaterium TaxID=1443666 RepID=UPI001585F4ED|nr:hypothetical protein [Aquimarina megaterium]
MKKTIKILGLIFGLVALGLLLVIIYHKYKNNNYDNEKAIEVWEQRQESYKNKDTIK